MMKKVVALSTIAIASISFLSAGNFNAQAEKDRKALVDYMMKKFENPLKNRNSYFPYSTDKELKDNMTPVKKVEDFRMGAYAFNKSGKEQYEEIAEMPPYEDAIDEGEELYNKTKGIKKCFPDPAIMGEYPKFDDKKGEVVTITSAINDCLKENGQKPWNPKKGKMAKLEAFFAAKSKDAGKKFNIQINSKAAAEAYERGKKEFYTQRGYLKLSCANCHVQGAGKRVRAEYMSSLVGQVTHFPVYRLKWQGLGTFERRLGGCNKNQGETPHKPESQWAKELLYFMAYMSNGLPVDGPDIRK